MGIYDGVFRIEPAMAPEAYQTYGIAQLQDTDRIVACSEVGCKSWLNGWETFVDERTQLGRMQARYIRQEARRDYVERKTPDGLTVFRFSPKQRCFVEHRTKPELYTRMPGDFRGATGPTYQHRNAADWVEDFGEHQIKIADQMKKG